MSNSLPAKAKVFDFKVGDTLLLGCAAADTDGLPFSLGGVTITSQIRSIESGELVCDMAVNVVNLGEGTYELEAPSDAPFTEGDYKIDVQYAIPRGAGSLIRSSETFYIRMVDDVTKI